MGQTLQITYKLNFSTLTMTSLSAQKVKFATKLFSRTNALAVKRAGELKLLKGNYKLLSVVIMLINDWFDIFNRRVTPKVRIPNLAPELKRGH